MVKDMSPEFLLKALEMRKKVRAKIKDNSKVDLKEELKS